MSPLDARVAKLTSEIERDWAQVRAHLAKAESVDASAGEPQAALVALSLDHAYQAFETLLVRLERALGLPERSGSAWHAQILHESGDPVPGLRPAVFPPTVASEWDALLRFRHFLRHAYAVGLAAAKLRANVERLARAVAATEPGVAALIAALRAE
jgi:hypothetical protein